MPAKVFKMFLIALLLQGSVDVAVARHHHRDRRSDASPGQFDYYLLSLSWAPAFCIQQPSSPECSGTRRFAFIVHGLWPQNEQGWPQNCGDNAQIPDSVAQGIADLMPSRKLVYHEWSTHGTCSGLDPEAYFELLRKAHASIAIPPQLIRPNAAIEQTPGAIVSAFLLANPRLPTDSVVVICSRQGAPRLREVHICLNRDLSARVCATDSLHEACRADSVIVPPVR